MFGMHTEGLNGWNAQNMGISPPNVNPWLVLAWLNQFNPYAHAFAGQPGWALNQPGGMGVPMASPQFNWNAFWNANPATSVPGMTNPTPGFGNLPAGQPGNSHGFFGTNFFNPTAQGAPWAQANFGNAPASGMPPFAPACGNTNPSSSIASTNSNAGFPGSSPSGAYPQYPGVPNFFATTPNLPVTPVNPLDEHVPPKRTARNGV